MVLPPFSVAVHYDMGHELENGLAGRRTRMDSRVAAPPDFRSENLPLRSFSEGGPSASFVHLAFPAFLHRRLFYFFFC